MKSLGQSRLFPPLLVGLLLVAAWYALRHFLALEAFRLPVPHEILAAIWKERQTLAGGVRVTFLASLGGFFAATFFGLALSLILTASRTLRRGFLPFVVLMQVIPIIATAAIVVTWLDAGFPAIITIAFFIGFFPVVANTLAGLRAVPAEQLELFRLYKATPLQELFLLRLPTAWPYFLTGAQIAATLAVIGSVTGEIFAGSSANAGLGFLIISYRASFETAAVFAATALCALLAMVFWGAVRLVPTRFPAR
ncbi:MAG: ABC transporter permease subunit [Opitutales bacterium]|nr:ABC transporter permease subunit [Opitutales bacterium]